MTYIKPNLLPKEYYSFKAYNTKQRMLTYWYQIIEALEANPKSIMEIGIGTGLVKSYLTHCGIDVKTIDINEKLKPDFNISILDSNLTSIVPKSDLVVCSRVLHHIEYSDFNLAIKNLASITNSKAILSLPVDELRLYFLFRITSSSFKTLSIKFPRYFKSFLGKIARVGLGSGLWQINSDKETSINNVRKKIQEYFIIEKDYSIKEDSSHMIFVLSKK